MLKKHSTEIIDMSLRIFSLSLYQNEKKILYNENSSIVVRVYEFSFFLYLDIFISPTFPNIYETPRNVQHHTEREEVKRINEINQNYQHKKYRKIYLWYQV